MYSSVDFSTVGTRHPIKVSFEEPMTPAAFAAWCTANPEVYAELESNGQITIMSPTGLVSNANENIIAVELTIWKRQRGQDGMVTSGTVGITLPDNSVRGPDAAYIPADRLSKLDRQDLKGFATVVPLFVAEVRSGSDRLKPLQRKMTDVWIANGVSLAILLDIEGRQTFIYRADGSIDVVKGTVGTISGEDVLPGFELDLSLFYW